MNVVERQLTQRLARAIGLRIPRDVELDELVDLLIASRARNLCRLRWADAENSRLRARVDALELAAELPPSPAPAAPPAVERHDSPSAAAPSPAGGLTMVSDAWLWRCEDCRAVTALPAVAVASIQAHYEADLQDEDVWDVRFGGWVS